tara:strand:+ start:129 stop:725 length:597 start_codon:yes stop_codon:yes gene_type:complete
MNNEMIEKIIDNIKLYHKIFRFPLKAELWEDIFDQAINIEKSRWEVGSHTQGGDVRGPDGITYQNKSGQIKNGKIQWSGNRLTRHNGLEAKIDFISSHLYDKYAFLARDINDWKNEKKIYHFIVFDSSFIDYSFESLKWKETYAERGALKGRCNGWKGKCSDYDAKIQKQMSDQLWTTAKLSYLKEEADIYEIIDATY